MLSVDDPTHLRAKSSSREEETKTNDEASHKPQINSCTGNTNMNIHKNAMNFTYNFSSSIITKNHINNHMQQNMHLARHNNYRVHHYVTPCI